MRIDYHFSQEDTLFGRYSYNRTQAYTPPYLPGVNGVQAGGNISGTLPGNNSTQAHNGQFGYTHVFTPNLLLELRARYTYFNLDATPMNNGVNLNDSAPYRIPNANECNVCSGLATFSVVGLAGLGDTISQPFYNQEHNTQFAGAVTYTRGHHTFKIVRRSFVVTSASSCLSIQRASLSSHPPQSPPLARTFPPSTNNSGGPLNRFFNTAAFAPQAIGTLGNESRNQVFGPHLRRGDLSLFKTIPVREGPKLEVRAECFNFTNTPNFALPSAVITAYDSAGVPLNAVPRAIANNATSPFGSITSTAFGYSGRQFQFAGRFNF